MAKCNNATPKKRAKKVSDEQISEAIRETGGNCASVCGYIAQNFGIDINRSTIYRRIQTSEELRQALDEAKERKLDMVEGLLDKLLKEGDKSAIFFYLKTQGKHRGWSERHEITGRDGRELNPAQVEIIRLPDNGRD